ncbi:hypothetical protein LJR231_001525 [Phyllobacterium sp. LjRoot231]|uniref:hypothetical protein n=1 Tax=Phyllobacterium sp. LjRoot231 TaxID=3342289 RepID=UPI003ECE3354
MTRPLHEVLRASLDTAVDENGYTELLTMRPEEVATDLATCDAEVEALKGKGWFHINELVPLIKQWQSDRRAKVLEV